MIYAHIFKDTAGWIVWYRYFNRCETWSDENVLKSKQVTTLTEPSGNAVLLDKKIAEWMKKNGVAKLDGFFGLHGMGIPSTEEYIEALKKEAYRMAAQLEREKKDRRALEEKYAFNEACLIECSRQLASVIKTMVEEGTTDLEYAKKAVSEKNKPTYH